METNEQELNEQEKMLDKPDDTSGLLIEAHLKIWDPESKEELVNTRSWAWLIYKRQWKDLSKSMTL